MIAGYHYQTWRRLLPLCISIEGDPEVMINVRSEKQHKSNCSRNAYLSVSQTGLISGKHHFGEIPNATLSRLIPFFWPTCLLQCWIFLHVKAPVYCKSACLERSHKNTDMISWLGCDNNAGWLDRYHMIYWSVEAIEWLCFMLTTSPAKFHCSSQIHPNSQCSLH